MLSAIQLKYFVIPIAYKRTQRLKYMELQFCQLFCVVVKLSLSPLVKCID
jgi:hypothetical protein